MTLVSIVVPMHNAVQYLPRTLEQLKAVSDATTYDIEFIAIDDHSVDGSPQLLHRWAEVLPNLRVLTAEGNGVARARNQAVEDCRGDFVWFTDADDTWSPRIVQAMADAAIQSNADLIVANAVKVSPDGTRSAIQDAPRAEEIDAKDVLERILDGRIQGHLWNKLFALQTLGVDPFPLTHAHSDLGGMLKLAPHITRAVLVPDELYVYEMRSGSILNSKNYRWQDLHDCLRGAEAAAERLPDTSRDALLSFKYRNVIVPVANELIRRDSLVTRLVSDDRFVRNRAAAQWREIRSLLRGKQTGVGLRAALLKMSSSLYVALYRAKLKGRRAVPISSDSAASAERAVTAPW